MGRSPRASPLDLFHPAVAEWFRSAFTAPTEPQARAWPSIAERASTLLLAPTGSGKTLAAFLSCIDRLMFSPEPKKLERCRVLYVSPLKALAVDVERNLRSPLAGISRVAAARGDAFRVPTVAIRTGDTPSRERAQFQRTPSDILITTPESVYLLLTSNAREVLRSIDTVIVDEIHALVPTKRGAHLALSLERLEAIANGPVQRIGLSATQRPLEEIARFLGGAEPPPREERGRRERPRALAAYRAKDETADEHSTAAAGESPRSNRRAKKAEDREGRAAGSMKPGVKPPAALRRHASGARHASELERSSDAERSSDKERSSDAERSSDKEHSSDAGRSSHAERSSDTERSSNDAPGSDAQVRAEPPRESDAALEARLEVEVSAEFEVSEPVRHRPVTNIDAGTRKALELRIEVPVEDMAKLGQPVELPSGPAAQGPVRTSIWTAIHPRLLELVRAHTSTLIFVNSRRISERLAAALNELAGEVLVQAHHGSIARDQRLTIEDNLKAGRVRGLVATSSLELGIDMGAVDLVVQIEAPPSVASGMQRIGRAGHTINAVSRGVLFPKYRADLVACAALTRSMHQGKVESTRYPRNPLDVLAQQIVAMVSMDDWDVDALYARVRAAAPFAELSRGIFENVLDMLSGRYVSDEFAELRPRITWHRSENKLVARQGARSVAVVNGGTIPDRGLYGVFLAGAATGTPRVGELDEEMVFESRVGETFLLGASTWRIEEITHDRVLVSPAPGEPGKMPFWHGDLASRPLELGREIGRLVRELRGTPRKTALSRLAKDHDLDPKAAENLLQYLSDQAEATGDVPDDRTIVIERCRDELGDWRICVLTPLGGQVLAPWSMAAIARAKERLGVDVETMWTNDGLAIRVPESDEAPDVSFLLPDPEEVEALVLRQLGGTALFAAKFREVAARALLLPRRHPGGRAPLWQQRKRAADLLAVASRYASFPMLLETYRECLRDVFDMPALLEVLREVRQRSIRVVTVDSATPSPFASSLLFGFVANYIYDGDAPLAERRAQALAIDQAQLRELLGEAELRELLDVDALTELEAQLQHRSERNRAKSVDGLADLLLRLGDLSRDELAARSVSPEVAAGAEALLAQRRALEVTIAGERRLIAIEDAARYRDTLGVPLPAGLPAALLAELPDPAADLALRYARTHGPFTTAELARRYGMGAAVAEALLRRLLDAGRLLEGAFRPGGNQREWCDPEVLRSLRRRSLSKLRKEVEPVEPPVLARFLTQWQGVTRRGRGLDAVLDAVEKLQGLALPASLIASEILPARVQGFLPSDLDALAAAGELVWVGVEPLGEHDGRVALYLADALPRLFPPRPTPAPELGELEAKIVEYLRTRGASFFADLHAAIGGGFPARTVDALWSLVWKGLITNDTFRALRAHTRARGVSRRDKRVISTGRAFRSRLTAPPSAEGRWTLVDERLLARPTSTEWSAAVAQQLLERYGVVTREVANAEELPGGFSAVYDVFKALEEAGRIRRGFFVSGVAAMQFALPPVLDRLRGLREVGEEPEVVVLAATDPANPYGALLPWPTVPTEGDRQRPPFARSVGAKVVLIDGALAAWVARGARAAWVQLPENEPDRSNHARALAEALAGFAARSDRSTGVLIAEINGRAAAQHPLAPFLIEAGFQPGVQGFHLPRYRAAGLLAEPHEPAGGP